MPVLPLFLDIVYIFMQRVNPPHLFDHIKQKLSKLENELDFKLLKWHLWSLDKSYVICEIKMRGEANVAQKVKEKLMKKWCQDVIIEI